MATCTMNLEEKDLEVLRGLRLQVTDCPCELEDCTAKLVVPSPDLIEVVLQMPPAYFSSFGAEAVARVWNEIARQVVDAYPGSPGCDCGNCQRNAQ